MSTTISGIGPGTVIGGRYEVGRLIGKGGMGAVFAATNLNSGRAVALKVIRSEIEHTPEQRRRFMREARAATAIQHPNVIEVLDVFEEDDGTLVMVMELLEGETLKDHRLRRGALTLHETAKLFLPIVEALHAAHDKGIVHRDLKPENVFLAETSRNVTLPKVLDFGIAKVLDPASLNAETQGGETKTGSLLGTPHYMSYEQAMSEKNIDQRSDVWSIGVMIFEALTGRRPIEFETLGEMYTKFLTGQVPSIRQLVPVMPDDAVEVLDRCLAKDRAERAPDLSALVQLLERYADPSVEGGHAGGQLVKEMPLPTESLSTMEASNAARSLDAESTVGRGPRPLLLVAVGAVILAGLGGYMVSRSGAGAAGAGDDTSDSAVLAAESASATDEALAASGPSTLPSATATPLASASASSSASSSSPPSPPPLTHHAMPPPPSAPTVAASAAPTPRPKGLAEEDPY